MPPVSHTVQILSPILGQEVVHVWYARLDQPETAMRSWTRNLSDVERARAERFFREKDRRRFVACHGILREILSRYLAIPADQVRFSYGRQGKPRVLDESGQDMLHFNLSHSDALAVFAFARHRPPGVDVERVRADLCWDEIAPQCFSRRESRRLQTLGERERCRAFLVAWTCKEAYVKARGEGLSFPLSRVEVSLFPPGLQYVEGEETEPSRWMLRELRVGDDYVATLAVEGHRASLVCRPWSRGLEPRFRPSSGPNARGRGTGPLLCCR